MTEIRQHNADSGAIGVLAIASTLLALGVIMVFSVGASVDDQQLDDIFNVSGFLKQALYAGLGFAVMLAVSRVPTRWFARWWLLLPIVLVSLCLLVAALVPGVGTVRQGARRWLDIGGLTFQPSELAKLTVVLFIAWWASRQLSGRPLIQRFWIGYLPAALVCGLFIGAVGLEDFGTAALLALVVGLMFLVGGARWWHLALTALPVVPAFIWLLTAKSYRMERVQAFLNPWEDPAGKGYHVIQSLCGIAVGGWEGKGLGLGIQKHGYLPAAHNDFVFSVICEELGGIGGLAVIGLFIALIVLGARAMLRAESPFGSMVAFGLTVLIAAQAAMNIAVVTGWAPAKGISLPLVSAGGSGVVFIAASVGVLAGVARSARFQPRERVSPLMAASTA